jgi:hypothetical protein
VSEWGLGQWGIGGWGIPGPGDQLELQFADAIRDNVVRLVFNRAVYFTSLETPNDGAAIGHYEVQAVAGTVGEDGLPARPVFVARVDLAAVEGAGGREIDVTVDRSFSPYPAQYLVSVNGLRATTGELLTPGHTSYTFFGAAEIEEQLLPGDILVRGDLANPQTRQAIGSAGTIGEIEAQGSYPVDETGDYSIDQGLLSYRKRIFRRLITRRGAFAHLPDYGVGTIDIVKQLSRPRTRETLAAEAEAQIQLEPETVAVSVRVRVVEDAQNPGLVFFLVKARTKAGDVVATSVPISIG